MSVCMSVGLSSTPSFLPLDNGDQRSCLNRPEFSNDVVSDVAVCLASHIGNSTLHAVTVYSTLGMIADVFALLLCLLGYRPVSVMRNPLLRSVSPRDFWGRRWNLVIHGILKVSCEVFYHMEFAKRLIAFTCISVWLALHCKCKRRLI
jgi:hypothetical protein